MATFHFTSFQPHHLGDEQISDKDHEKNSEMGKEESATAFPLGVYTSEGFESFTFYTKSEDDDVHVKKP